LTPGREPRCFISYTWETSDHKTWVRNLATKLTENGVDVILDQWELKYGHDLGKFMETSVRESNFVILVCTPTYAKKADKGSGGAGYEKQIVTGEMFQGSEASKFIPLVRSGSIADALPSFLKSKNYVDFRSDSEFDEKLKDLLYQLHGKAKYSKPKIGPSPFPRKRTESRDNNNEPTIPNLPPDLNEALTFPQKVRAGRRGSSEKEWDIEEKFQLDPGEYQEITLEMESGNRLSGYVDSGGPVSSYLLGSSSWRSFGQGLGFNYFWGRDDVEYTKVSHQASETRTYHFVVSNGSEDEEDDDERETVSVEVKLNVR